MQIGHGPPFVRESLFGGCGRVLVWNLLGRRAAPPFTAVLSCVLEEKGRVGRHVQDEYDEIIVGLTGYGEARVDGKPQPFGSHVRVTNAAGKSVVVTINDRGPFHGGRVIDLSQAAAAELGIVRAGSGRVQLALLD